MDRYSDDIESLPLDNFYVPSQNEKQIIDSLFGVQDKWVISKITNELKDLFIIAILFVLFSMKNVDELIHKFVPASQNSVYILLLIKTLGFVVLFWIAKNFYLSRGN
jgi:hypothetical protein